MIDDDDATIIDPIVDTSAGVSPTAEAWYMFRRNKAAMFGLILLIVLVGMTTIGPALYQNEALKVVTRPRLSPGNSDLLMGSDYLGRDTWAGILEGGRVTLLIALAAGSITVLIGLLLGAPAGYFGGRVESVLMRFTEIFQVPPPILLAMLILLLWGPSTRNLIGAVAAVAWPQTARLARGEFLRLRDLEYVRAAKAAGAGDLRIMTTIILVSGFTTVVASDLPGHRSFAQMACMTIGSALVADLLFLPALLALGQRRDSPT